MEDSVLKNYQAELSKKYDRLTALVEPYLEEAGVQAEMDGIALLQGKIRDAKPEIMFYGIYNAGKSSVLNELLGSDKAKVDDIPTTDRIDRYEWNGYRIVDTPGVDAPIEHENVTEAHLAEADVVLFVISAEGSHEYLENYRRLKAIADRGKKIIIVLNDKEGKLAPQGKGYDELTEEQRQAAEELGEVKRKVAANCRAVGLKDDDYVLVEVNAKRARTGRLKGKPGLIDRSNMKTLESCIFSELKRMPTFDILRRAVTEIEQHLDCIVASLEKAETDAGAQTMNGFLERIHAEKKAAREEVAAYIDRRASRLGKELPSLIWAHRSEGQEAINALVSKQQEAFVQDVQQKMQLVIRDLLENLNVALENLVDSIDTLQISPAQEIALEKPNVPALDMSVEPGQKSTGNEKWVAVIDTLQEILKATGPITETTAGSPLAGTIAKSFGTAALGKALTGPIAAPIIGTIPPATGTIILLGLLKSFLGGSDDKEKRARAEAENERQRRMAEAELQARQELQQRCKYIAEGIGDQIRMKVDLLIHQILDDVQRPFKEQAASSKGDAQKRLNDLNAMRELSSEYEAVRYELSAMV